MVWTGWVYVWTGCVIKGVYMYASPSISPSQQSATEAYCNVFLFLVWFTRNFSQIKLIASYCVGCYSAQVQKTSITISFAVTRSLRVLLWRAWRSIIVVEPLLNSIISIGIFLTVHHSIDFLRTPHVTKSESMEANWGNKMWQLETFENPFITNYGRLCLLGSTGK